MKSARVFKSGGLPTKNDIDDDGGGWWLKAMSAAMGGNG